ncbi:phosphatidate cytidylyltransferase [Candidatus Aminicenantes bacterium AC-334-K16]|jgi:phosphatidate cytidylyltransferase|nr:phosphatidate cytidylyltransferase [Candidatus Aminicenantes bacterium AC-334-K16]
MDLKKRLPTALVLLAIIFVTIQFAPAWLFFIILQIIVIAALMEFYGLCHRRAVLPQRFIGLAAALVLGSTFYFPQFHLDIALFIILVMVGFYYLLISNSVEKVVLFPQSIALTFFGVLYISFTLNFAFPIRQTYGPYIIYFLFAVIFIGDTGAYFIGKMWGRRPLAPIASPKKTWEGSLGGVITACLGGVLVQQLLWPSLGWTKALVFAFFINLLAQISDPVESLFKRAVGVKDSSNLLPGHGGFLDRVDSLIFALPFFYFLVRWLRI